MPPRSTEALGLTLLCLLRVIGDGWLLWRDPPRFVNHEEAYNATAGWLLWHTGEWGQLLELQYRSFCGGCSVVAAAAGPTLGLLGDSFLAWKGLALAWALATLVAAWFAFRELAGSSAGWVAAALLALPFAGLSELGLMLWGNHQESALFLLGALSLRRRPLAQALLLGLSLAFCRTSLYFVVVLLPLTVRTDWRTLGPFALGLTPLLLPAAGSWEGAVPMAFGVSENLAPEGLEGVWRRLGLLLDPRELGPRLFLAPDSALPALAVLGAALVAAAVQLRARRFLWVALAVSFGAAFCVTGFKVPLAAGEMPVVNARYHAPWMLLLLLAPALAPGRWKALALVSLLASLGARGLKDAPRPVSWETLSAARAAQPWSFHALSRERFDVAGVDSDEPRAHALLLQMRGDLPPEWASVDRALRGRPARGWGAGIAAVRDCGKGERGARPTREQLVDCLVELDLGPEERFGVGLALAADFRDRGDLQLAVDRLGPEVQRGAAHPLAGVDRPLSGPSR